MWLWVLGGIVVVALIGGAISTYYEDKLWEEFLRRLWRRIMGQAKTMNIKATETDGRSGTAEIVKSKPNPPT